MPAEPILVPAIQLLEAIKQTLSGLNFQNLAGYPVTTVRHFFGRYASTDELSCISIRFLSQTDQEQGDKGYYTLDETIKNLSVDLVVEGLTPTEESEEDPTGLNPIMAIANAAADALVDASSAISALAHSISVVSIEPDEVNQTDVSRLTVAILISFRVSRDNPMRLLHAGLVT